MTKKIDYRLTCLIMAWSVHILTASAAFIGLLTLAKIYEHQYIEALWLMAAATFIDAIDGTLARPVRVKTLLPAIDAALLDNIVDYVNYVITPCFFLLVKTDMLPEFCRLLLIFSIIISSSYQFCQVDAKTPDHFFKGFPCYWNIAIFYMIIFESPMLTNAMILTLLCLLIFVPIKYVYPSRLDYLSHSNTLRNMMYLFSGIYGLSSLIILWSYPEINQLCFILSMAYISLYLFFSLYRTYSPIILSKLSSYKDE